MLLKNMNELMYENEVLDLPYNPDVGDYLQFKVFLFYIYIIWSGPNIWKFNITCNYIPEQ